MNAGANLTLSEITCLHRQKCLFVFLFCVLPGGKRKWGKCDLPATEEQEKHRQGRGEDWGDVGRERWGQNKVPRTHRTIYVQTLLHGEENFYLMPHESKYSLDLVGQGKWQGQGKKTTGPQLGRINFATDIAPPANDRHGLSQ
jgi:hypothetical protein